MTHLEHAVLGVLEHAAPTENFDEWVVERSYLRRLAIALGDTHPKAVAFLDRSTRS